MPGSVTTAESLRFVIPDSPIVSGGGTEIDLSRSIIEPTRYGVRGNWTYASMRPFPHGATTTAGSVSGRIYYAPYTASATWPIIGISLELTVAAVATASTVQFAFYSQGANGLPEALVEDWSSAGALNLITGGPGFPALSFARRTVPVGALFIAALFLATGVTTAPTFRCPSGGSPSVGGASPTISSSGFVQVGASSFPAMASPSGVATPISPLIYFQCA